MTEKQKLRIIKYQKKCEEKNFEFIKHFRGNKKTLKKTKCNKCNYIKDFDCGALIKGYIRCSNCLINKYKNMCIKYGYDFISLYCKNKKISMVKCKCNNCDYVNDFGSSNLIKGQISCNNCLINILLNQNNILFKNIILFFNIYSLSNG